MAKQLENYSEKGGPIIPGSNVEPYLLLHFEEQVLLSAFLVGSTGLTYFNLDYFQLLSVSCFPWLTATGAESSELADLD